MNDRVSVDRGFSNNFSTSEAEAREAYIILFLISYITMQINED